MAFQNLQGMNANVLSQLLNTIQQQSQLFETRRQIEQALKIDEARHLQNTLEQFALRRRERADAKDAAKRANRNRLISTGLTVGGAGLGGIAGAAGLAGNLTGLQGAAAGAGIGSSIFSGGQGLGQALSGLQGTINQNQFLDQLTQMIQGNQAPGLFPSSIGNFRLPGYQFQPGF